MGLSSLTLLPLFIAPLFAHKGFAIAKPVPLQLAQNEEIGDRQQILAEADRLFIEGKGQEAENLYRQAKPDFPEPDFTPSQIPDPVYEIDALSGGQRLWQNALDGITQGLPTKKFSSLHRMADSYPEFIPAHLKLADACLENGAFCENFAIGEDSPKNATQVVERVTRLYPEDIDLLYKKLDIMEAQEMFLEASIAARQFSITYQDIYPEEISELTTLADDYLKRYQRKVKREVEGNTWISFIFDLGKLIATRDPNQLISGIQLLSFLGQGEEKFGAAAVESLVEQRKEEGELVEDPEVIEYIEGIAGKFTQYMGRDFNYEYYVIQDPNFNAFVYPGGKVVVHTGLILQTNSEAELAGILAHEVAHAALSHGFQNMARSGLLNRLGDTIPLVNIVTDISNAKYSREHERQADILGTRVLAASGYAADGLRNAMVHLRQQNGGETNLLSSHPAPRERVRYLESLIVGNGYNRYAYEGIETHRKIQQKLSGEFVEPEVAEEETEGEEVGGVREEEGLGIAPELGTPESDLPSGEATQTPPPLTEGPVTLISSQIRNDVKIQLNGAEVQPDGQYTIRFSIENRSDETFLFVLPFAAIQNENGDRISAKFSLLSEDPENIDILPGETREGEVWIIGKNWNPDTKQQELYFVITTGNRRFRIPF
ncbi:M48 family metallopeptidase [Spirulina sp. 06S082]|uniref:M48 family metallopeptidase n=1 Tax=Spirulina sp. 06S082 TaxID=3110248 RepID=UPI002B21726E|nr:M48 family metallopeptidase [Spirulina sp. 06S082]MEA5469424.1 M48 family metallopeptidase [Spirulina sp. 06S082]